MDFHISETKINLAKAFAGESQARNRYDFLAEQFYELGYAAIASEIDDLARQELAHARVFYNFITEYGKSCPNIEISAGYPFKTGDLLENTKHEVENEREEAENIYQQFAETAKREDYNEVALAFSNIAKIENIHKQKLAKIANGLESGTLYKSVNLREFSCENCGYTFNSLEAFKNCPVCRHNQGFVAFEL